MVLQYNTLKYLPSVAVPYLVTLIRFYDLSETSFCYRPVETDTWMGGTNTEQFGQAQLLLLPTVYLIIRQSFPDQLYSNQFCSLSSGPIAQSIFSYDV